jgi:AMP nucleosidase
MLSPSFIAPLHIEHPVAALAQVRTIYEHSIAHLRGALERFIAGEKWLGRDTVNRAP